MLTGQLPAHGRPTALIVTVPAAEPVVGRHRARLDPNAAIGIPAHVTILAPFVPRERLGSAELARLGALFASADAFDVVLDHTDWFGTAVLWIGPADPEPFRALTALVFAGFPEFPPFEGRHAEVIPHLTVGIDAPVAQMRRAEAEIAGQLPICSRVSAVTLMADAAAGNRWEVLGSFPLGT